MLGQNLLSLSTEFSLECLRLVLDVSKDIIASSTDLADTFGRVPLHLAAANTETSALKLLVHHGFKDFRYLDNLGYTPLHIACMKGIKDRILNDLT